MVPRGRGAAAHRSVRGWWPSASARTMRQSTKFKQLLGSCVGNGKSIAEYIERNSINLMIAGNVLGSVKSTRLHLGMRDIILDP